MLSSAALAAAGSSAVPIWIWEAEEAGYGKALYDVTQKAAWEQVFGGNIPSTVGYALKETLEKDGGATQAYVNGVYRSMKYLKTATPEEIYDLIGPKYMASFKKEAVLREILRTPTEKPTRRSGWMQRRR